MTVASQIKDAPSINVEYPNCIKLRKHLLNGVFGHGGMPVDEVAIAKPGVVDTFVPVADPKHFFRMGKRVQTWRKMESCVYKNVFV